MLILFSITIFVGAALLFLVQPMFARMVLPLLGGSPAVWNTAMVFYQAALLAGYAYAHFATRWLGVRRQAGLHLVVLLAPLLVLPIGLPLGWMPPTATNPVWWLLMVMAVSVGLPFFVVSATSPLLQRWFAASGHKLAADPYFLYAASNCGSLLALVSYPILIEPRLGLAEQSWCWAAGYGVLVVLTVICGLMVRRNVREAATTEGTKDDDRRHAVSAYNVDHTDGRITAGRRVRWLLLAFVPCSLMLSVTTYITSEIAPIPLLWVIPLGIYLLTFILVFARRRLVPHTWMVRTLPFVVLALPWTMVWMLMGQPLQPLGWLIALHLAGLFVVAMVCHGELANDRPPTRYLTEFYLWLSAGGVLGGMFNALLAPWLFRTVIEYPVTLVLACALMPRRAPAPSNRRTRILDVALPVLLGLFTAGGIVLLNSAWHGQRWLAPTLAYVVPAVLCLGFARHPLRLALGVVAILVGTILPLWPYSRTIHMARSFFGIHRIVEDPLHEYHLLKHGQTVHGAQSLDPARRAEPLAYYTRSGPLEDVWMAVPAPLKQRVAVVGLGAGTMACYGLPGQKWTFYEIDPVVERIARDPRFFTYLTDCRANVEVVLGDARLSLQQAPDGQFDLLILDAYSSDTLPLHLITREALTLYLRKLTPNGVLVFHISTRHLDLEPVLANLAQDAGLFALNRNDSAVGAEAIAHYRLPSRWVVMTRHPASLQTLRRSGYWSPPRPRADVGVWTDDYESLFRVWSWR